MVNRPGDLRHGTRYIRHLAELSSRRLRPDDMQSEFYSTGVLVGLFAAFVAWLLSSLWHRARANAGIRRAESSRDIELATLRERAARVVALESELEAARQQQH